MADTSCLCAASGLRRTPTAERPRYMRRRLTALLSMLTLLAVGQVGGPATHANAATAAYTHVAVYAGSACMTSPALSMAVQPTGVLDDGAGGFYVAIAD